MTKTLILFVTLFTTLNLLGQNFEGQITYQNTFKSKLPNITDQQWVSMMGATQNFFIKEGNYRSTTNGTVVQWQLYINSDNKLYNKVATSEAILWNDGASNPDEVLKAEVKSNAAEILGYKCNELTLTCKSGVQKYYFAPTLPVESFLFEKHKYGNWSEYISRARSLPLKIVIDNAQFTMESTATEVKPMLLDNTLFTLPADAKTVKSPY
jgi:hypothetical protein